MLKVPTVAARESHNVHQATLAFEVIVTGWDGGSEAAHCVHGDDVVTCIALRLALPTPLLDKPSN